MILGERRRSSSQRNLVRVCVCMCVCVLHACVYLCPCLCVWCVVRSCMHCYTCVCKSLVCCICPPSFVFLCFPFPFPSLPSLAPFAATGTQLRCDVFVDTIHKIEITTTTRELLLEEAPEMFDVRAFDEEGTQVCSVIVFCACAFVFCSFIRL